MKGNSIKSRRTLTGIITLIALVIAGAVAVGAIVAYQRLRSVWNEQFVLTDLASQTEVNEGTMIKGATILDALGLKNGVNLADVDFDKCRTELLAKIPNIRAISICRVMPNRVVVTVEERTPVVKMSIRGQKNLTGRVADTDGVVFTCRRGTGMLPSISEAASSTTPVGGRLSGHRLAALRMIETAANGSYPALGILDVDTTKRDFLVATLGNYAIAKIRWDGIDDPVRPDNKELARTLGNLNKAIQSNVGSDAKIWNAVEPNRIQADTREKIL